MEEIELRDYFHILVKKAWLIALITILCVVTSGIISFFVLEPEYQTFTTLIVGKPKDYNDEIEYTDVLLNQKLVSTYEEIVKSKTISKEVIKNLKLNIIPEALKGKVSVTSVRDTQIIKIQVTDRNPELAAKMANELASVFAKHVVKIMKIDNIQVIDTAEVPISPIKPRPVLNIAIAGVLGIMISVFLVFLLEYLDNTIKTAEDIQRYLDLPVIGMIPKSN